MSDPESNLPAVVAPIPEASAMLVSVEDLERGLAQRVKMVEAIRRFMGSLLRPDIDYGVIPGTQKPTLLQPGAENLALAAQAHYEVASIGETKLTGDHIDVRTTVKLLAKNGAVLGEGVGSCSTMETKYRWRFSNKVCPDCEKETIRKSKPEKGSGWYCWSKLGGCGAQFKKGDERIEDQMVGKVENEDIADTWNTVRKISFKRAMIAAAKAGFGVSSLFTQDVEDMHNGQPEPNQPQSPTTSSQRKESPSRQARASATMPGSSPTRATPAPAASPVSEEDSRISVAQHKVQVAGYAICDVTKTPGETPEQRRERMQGIVKEVAKATLKAEIPQGAEEWEKLADTMDRQAFAVGADPTPF